MSAGSVASVILSVLESQRFGPPVSVRDIVQETQKRTADRQRIPGENEIRGRLTTLYNQGVVEKAGRGKYVLTERSPEETDDLVRLLGLLQDLLPADAFTRSVIWDASPYLELAEDGGPGTRLVLEHENAGSFPDELTAHWQGDEPVHAWVGKTTGPLGPLLWEPKTQTQYRIPFGIVCVERTKYGATGLTPRGYRAPFPERVLMEVLGPDGPPEATSIAQAILNSSDTEYERLRHAAVTLGESETLSILLAGAGDRVPNLYIPFNNELSPVVKAFVTGER